MSEPAETTDALERGRWWSAAFGRSTEPQDGTPQRARLLALQRVVAASMSARARGDVRTAWIGLQNAMPRLPAALTRVDPDDVNGLDRLAMLGPSPQSRDALPMWTYRTIGVVVREQGQLIRLRGLFALDRAPLDEWVDACVEYLGRVEFVDTWTHTGDDAVVAHLDSGRAAMLRRVNRLRRFADPTADEVGIGVWRNLGGYENLRAAALRALREQPLVDWESNASARHIPVDDGRKAAWTFAAGN